MTVLVDTGVVLEMKLDDTVVVSAELEGMRLLARLDRPKITVVQEDLVGASCLWEQSSEGGHRDLVRLRPGSGVPLSETLRAIRGSTVRRPGGHLEIRGTEGSLLPGADLLTRLGGRENLDLPRALMARDLGDQGTEADQLSDGTSVEVADDAESLVELRKVVGQAFTEHLDEPEDGADEDEPGELDVEADFFHAPGVMTYLAVRAGDSIISAGSILIVDRVANVWSVATSPEHRGQGAASAIMRAVCREAGRRGAEAAALRTTEDLARPGGLYDTLGFELLGHEHIWEVDDVDSLHTL